MKERFHFVFCDSILKPPLLLSRGWVGTEDSVGLGEMKAWNFKEAAEFTATGASRCDLGIHLTGSPWPFNFRMEVTFYTDKESSATPSRTRKKKKKITDLPNHQRKKRSRNPNSNSKLEVWDVRLDSTWKTGKACLKCTCMYVLNGVNWGQISPPQQKGTTCPYLAQAVLGLDNVCKTNRKYKQRGMRSPR